MSSIRTGRARRGIPEGGYVSIRTGRTGTGIEIQDPAGVLNRCEYYRFPAIR
jgi:hypothetical protein